MDMLLLLLLFSPICVLCQTIQESGPGIVKPSEQLKLTCTVSGFELTSYSVHWIRQVPGKGLEWIGALWTDGTTAYVDSLKSRTTISKDNSKKQVYLQINNMETADTGMYYCARDGAAYYFDIWGNGQSVIVSSETVKKPDVFPLKPCESLTSDIITIGFLATGYIPGPVKFQWNSGTIKSAPKEMTIQSSGKLTSGSFLAIPRSTLEKENVTCTVEHAPTNFKISKGIGGVKEVIKDKVKIYAFCPHHQEITEAASNSQLSLVCMIKSFSKDDINVSWLQGRSSNNGGDIMEFKGENQKKNVKFSVLTISKAHWESNKMYTCKCGEGEAFVYKDICTPGKN